MIYDILLPLNVFVFCLLLLLLAIISQWELWKFLKIVAMESIHNEARALDLSKTS